MYLRLLSSVVLSTFLLVSCSHFNNSKVINGCEITATNYQAALDAKNILDPSFHSRILIVGYRVPVKIEANGVVTPMGGMHTYHAYCVWRSKGMYYAYDYQGTSRLVPNLDGTASAIFFARQLHPTAFEGFFEGENGRDSNFEN